LTENNAAIPFLWVLPLSLYLLSFILCFDSGRWYRRWLFTPLAASSVPLTAWLIFGGERISDLRLLDVKSVIALLCAATFLLFMVCHGELARRRPAPAYLTSFYLMVAAGGALGGLFIGLAAPYLFNAAVRPAHRAFSDRLSAAVSHVDRSRIVRIRPHLVHPRGWPRVWFRRNFRARNLEIVRLRAPAGA
jgi:hypothetical protein